MSKDNHEPRTRVMSSNDSDGQEGPPARDEVDERPSRSMRRTGSKPTDMPRRALTAYNFFFQEQRQIIRGEWRKKRREKKDDTKKFSHGCMARIVSKRWKEIMPHELSRFKRLAAEDMQRYCREMEEYQQEIAKKYGGGSNSSKPSIGANASKMSRKKPAPIVSDELSGTPSRYSGVSHNDATLMQQLGISAASYGSDLRLNQAQLNPRESVAFQAAARQNEGSPYPPSVPSQALRGVPIREQLPPVQELSSPDPCLQLLKLLGPRGGSIPTRDLLEMQLRNGLQAQNLSLQGQSPIQRMAQQSPSYYGSPIELNGFGVPQISRSSQEAHTARNALLRFLQDNQRQVPPRQALQGPAVGLLPQNIPTQDTSILGQLLPQDVQNLSDLLNGTNNDLRSSMW